MARHFGARCHETARHSVPSATPVPDFPLALRCPVPHSRAALRCNVPAPLALCAAWTPTADSQLSVRLRTSHSWLALHAAVRVQRRCCVDPPASSRVLEGGSNSVCARGLLLKSLTSLLYSFNMWEADFRDTGFLLDLISR